MSKGTQPTYSRLAEPVSLLRKQAGQMGRNSNWKPTKSTWRSCQCGMPRTDSCHLHKVISDAIKTDNDELQNKVSNSIGYSPFTIICWIEGMLVTKAAYGFYMTYCPGYGNLYMNCSRQEHHRHGADFQNGFFQKYGWKFILRINFVGEYNNHFEPHIQGAHLRTAHGGSEQTIKYWTDPYHWQSFSAPGKKFVHSYDIHQLLRLR